MSHEPKAFLALFRDVHCEACGRVDPTVVPAHCNIGVKGGTGYKAKGLVAALCKDCHDVADGRVDGRMEERLKVWTRVAQTFMRRRYDEWRDG